MPVISKSAYKPPFWLRGGHTQTCFPSLLRLVKTPAFKAIRIDTPDSDFLDLDLAECGLEKPPLVIISHGLEGHSRRKYVCGMANAFLEEGFDALAWNFRFCSGTMNKTPKLSHSGDITDIGCVIEYACALGYERIVLAGFSMGGNQILKYLGELDSIPQQVAGAVTFSVPCDLAGCSLSLEKKTNRIYMHNFMRTLRWKVREKHSLMPELYPVDNLDEVITFRQFDTLYTAPIHGFASAEDYWAKASSLRGLEKIRLPTLLVNAANDPFLSEKCYPYAPATASGCFYLEVPAEGGHVGFTSFGKRYWSEQRAVEFVRLVIGI